MLSCYTVVQHRTFYCTCSTYVHAPRREHNVHLPCLLFSCANLVSNFHRSRILFHLWGPRMVRDGLDRALIGPPSTALPVPFACPPAMPVRHADEPHFI